MFLLTWSGSAETRKEIFTVRLKEAELVVYFSVHLSSLFFFLNDLIKLVCIGRYYCCNCLHLEFKRTFIFKLTIAQQFLDRCFKRRYISKKLEIGELLKVQDHRICRKVSSIPNHPRRANSPETKITRYNLRNKSPPMPAIHTDRLKNTFFNRIVFKYNVVL